MGDHTTLQAESSNGERLSLQHTSSDSPILPAPNLAQLYEIDPSLVQFVVDQTKIEADHRRSLQKNTNRFIFAERISGVVLGAIVAIAGLALGSYVILQGHDWAGAAVCGTTLVGMVSVIVTRQHNENKENAVSKPLPSSRRPRQKR